jgi:hypothetical protein
MWLATYIPELTVAEADRCWMPPFELCLLAGMDKDTPEMRRFLNNISDRGYIPFVKSGPSRTSPRVYSCISAIMMRAITGITASGRTYEFAAPIARHVADLARDMIRRFNTLDMLDKAEPDWLVVYEADHNGFATRIRTVDSEALLLGTFRQGRSYDQGVLLAGDLIAGVLRHYPDHWAKDLIRRGISKEKPQAFDVHGFPLDPDHPWNREK